MANKPLDEFALEFITKGSKQVITDMQEIINKQKQMQKVIEGTANATDEDTGAKNKNTDANNKNTLSINKQSSALWKYGKRLVSVYALYKLFNKGIGLAVNFAEHGNALANMSTLSGASTGSLQKWGYSLKKFGGSEQSAAGVLGAIQDKLFRYRYKGEDTFSDFMQFGGSVPVGTNAEDFLIDVARQMEGRSDDQKRYLASTLGLDPAMTAFLMQGSKAVMESLNKSEALMSPEDIKAAQDAKEKLEEFNRQLEKTGVVIGRVILPYLTGALKQISQFFKAGDKIKWIQKKAEKFGEWLFDHSKKDPSKGLLEAYVGNIAKPIDNIMELKSKKNQEKAAQIKEFHNAISNGSFLLNPSIIGGSSLNSNLNQNNSITINGADSPQQTGQEVVRAISNWSGESMFNQVYGFISKEKA